MSLHIQANRGDIAENILLPGDPLRAKWIAETFLEDAVLYNDVRNMFGYTGFYKNKRVSIQGTGMGVPSISIYTQELITEFGVKKLIRVGTAGSYQQHVQLRDIVLAMSASTNSGMNRFTFDGEDFAPTADFDLLMKAVEIAKTKNIPTKAGNILTSDIFYHHSPEYFKKWAEHGVLCVEMESAALYTLAAKFKVQALTILTISDSLVTHESTTVEDRESTFKDMVTIALETF